jgi:hypothetical protein
MLREQFAQRQQGVVPEDLTPFVVDLLSRHPAFLNSSTTNEERAAAFRKYVSGIPGLIRRYLGTFYDDIAAERDHVVLLHHHFALLSLCDAVIDPFEQVSLSLSRSYDSGCGSLRSGQRPNSGPDRNTILREESGTNPAIRIHYESSCRKAAEGSFCAIANAEHAGRTNFDASEGVSSEHLHHTQGCVKYLRFSYFWRSARS